MAAIDKSLFDIVGHDPGPSTDPAWLVYPVQTMHLNDGTFHADVINHYQRRLNENGIMTDSHETTHMINNEIRNAHSAGTKVNAFYVGESKAALVPEPNMLKSAVARYVPRSLQASRFAVYITGQTAWNDSPLYVYDEWTAYVNGGRTGVDMVERKLYNDTWTDGVCGLLEFCIYATALVMAANSNDNSCTQPNTQFMLFTNWMLRHAKAVYDKGSVMTEFKWDAQDKLLASWRASADAKDMRDFMTKFLDTSWIS